MDTKNLIFNKKVNWAFIIFISLTLSIYSSLFHSFDRPDFKNYALLFDNILSNDYFFSTVNNFGFNIYVKFIHLLGFNFRFFIWITAFFAVSIKIFLLTRLSRDILYSTLIYTLLVFPIHELIQIKIGLATSIFFLSLYLYNQKSFLTSLILFIISLSLHLVTLALLIGAIFAKSILLFIHKDAIPKKINTFSLITFLIIFIISIIRFTTLNNNLIYYFSESNIPSNIFSVRSSLLFLMTIFGLKDFKNFPDNAQNWFCLSLVGLTSYYLFSMNLNVSTRLMQAVYFPFIIWINYMPRNKYLILRYILLLVSLIFTYLLNFN